MLYLNTLLLLISTLMFPLSSMAVELGSNQVISCIAERHWARDQHYNIVYLNSNKQSATVIRCGENDRILHKYNSSFIRNKNTAVIEIDDGYDFPLSYLSKLKITLLDIDSMDFMMPSFPHNALIDFQAFDHETQQYKYKCGLINFTVEIDSVQRCYEI